MHLKGSQSHKKYIYIAGLITLVGLAAAAWLFRRSGLASYPNLIKEAYQETQHYLEVPGSSVVELTRTGAYGIYYEQTISDDERKALPALECSLTTKSTGSKIEAVPDYVKTNRYASDDLGRSGVLIMSITVNKPDAYTFACDFQGDHGDQEITVSLGPNYLWEFFKVVGKISLPVAGGVGIICSSILIAFIFATIGVIKRAVK